MMADKRHETPGRRAARRMAVTVVLLLSVHTPAIPGRADELPAGYVDTNRIYTCARDGGTGVDNPLIGQDYVRVEVWDPAGRKLASHRQAMLAYRHADTPLRWRIAHSCLWVLGQTAVWNTQPGLRVPLGQLGDWDKYWEKMTAGAGTREKAGTTPKAPREADPALSNHDWGVGPVDRMAAFVKQRIDLPTFDLLPTSSDSCFLFVLKDSTMSVFEGKGLPPPKGLSGYLVSYNDKAESRFKMDFQDQFRVFGTRDTFIFVPPSGKVYVAKRGGALESVKVLWNHSDWPVVAAVVDVPSDTTFLLAQETMILGGRKCLRLDKDGQLTVTAVDPMKMKQLPFSRPLETCVPFAQYLLAEGLLTGKGGR